MVVVHQSDLQAINRCPQEFKLSRTGARSDQNSGTVFGSVMHHALLVLGRTGDLAAAKATFDHYWHPLNVEAICPPIPTDGWLPGHSYGSLRKRGLDTLDKIAEWLRIDKAEVLALEFDFIVPLRGTEHYLAGQIDKLVIRWRKALRELHVEDWKTGKQKWGLRWNVQGTVYTYATLQPEFWTGTEVTARRLGGGEKTYVTDGFGDRARELALRLDDDPRRFTWLNLQTFKAVDGGYRGPQDYERLRLAVEQAVAMDEAGIYPLRLDGETCQFCNFRRVCGDVPVPPEQHGDPFPDFSEIS